jgi:phosphotransferase system HPr (HPr) family protein
MIQKQVQVNIDNGLHARPAGELVKMLKNFQSEVHLVKEGKKFNLRSIIHIMTTSIRERDVILLEINGEDETEVLANLEAFFGSH